MDYGIPGFEIHQIPCDMDLVLLIKFHFILDGFGFTKEIYEMHEFYKTNFVYFLKLSNLFGSYDCTCNIIQGSHRFHGSHVFQGFHGFDICMRYGFRFIMNLLKMDYGLELDFDSFHPVPPSGCNLCLIVIKV